jgi:hypothetical protein
MEMTKARAEREEGGSMNDIRTRLRKLEQRRPQHELPPLIIRADISREEALQIEYDWIKEHGGPGPLIVTTQRETSERELNGQHGD